MILNKIERCVVPVRNVCELLRLRANELHSHSPALITKVPGWNQKKKIYRSLLQPREREKDELKIAVREKRMMCCRFTHCVRLIRLGFISICKKCYLHEWVLNIFFFFYLFQSCISVWYRCATKWLLLYNHHCMLQFDVMLKLRFTRLTFTIVFSSVRFHP